ncbi:MAG: hypothetical protein U0232_07035 [Thermomicrobiales bacterium]
MTKSQSITVSEVPSNSITFLVTFASVQIPPRPMLGAGTCGDESLAQNAAQRGVAANITRTIALPELTDRLRHRP